MCTASIIPRTDGRAGLRIVFNRDELRSRPAALMVQEHRYDHRHALLPRDPVGGGTWIAASNAGVVLMLLNVNDEAVIYRAADPNRRSRGLIIPSLLHLDSVDAMTQQSLQLHAGDFDPFRLIIVSSGGCIELHSDGAAIRCRGAVLPGRVAMFTSSSLGDQFVESPRRRLFDAMLGDGLHCTERQDAFHQHQWQRRPHLSVWMSRSDARTVSRTVIDMDNDQIIMRYAALDEHGCECDATTHILSICHEANDAPMGADPVGMSSDTTVMQGAQA